MLAWPVGRTLNNEMTAKQEHGSRREDSSDRVHAVHFYARDDELADNVAAFIGQGLLAGETAVIIATEPHRRLFVERLQEMEVDVEAARVAGNLTILDAEVTLAKLTVDGVPDPELFRQVVGGVIAAGCARGPHPVKLRAYGEMVDMLWRAGNQAAAIALEEMWNELAAVHAFDLLCAYAISGFHAGRDAGALSEIGDLHSQVSAGGADAGEDEGLVGSADAAGLAARTRALAAEISHRKQIERSLRDSVRALRAAEASERERAVRMKQLADDLRETVRINELFMGVLAHDLRAPLGAIMTAGQLILARDQGGEGRNTRALGRILSSGERMSRMIEQLLDFTRLRVGGGIELDAAAADLMVLARQAVDELDDAYPDCVVDVRTVGDTTGRWDHDRLSQVLSNLVANALQHGVPAAGVRVVIDGSDADTVQVQVHNMGAIPVPLIAEIFEPLTGGQRRRDRSRSLGLGLFLSKRIAAAHGGDVEVSSSESEGTTFTLSLPRIVEPAAARLAVSKQDAEGGARKRPHERINLAELAQDQLRQSETRFRLLVEAVKDYAIFMLDPNGRIMTWNAGAQRIKGYDAREIIGQHFSVFYEEHEIRAGKCERELEGAARDGRFEDEGWRLRKDGSKFWANVVITALRGERGELVGFAKVTRDLSERRRLELEQLRAAKAEEAIRLRDEFLSLAAHELKTPLTVLQLQLDTLGDRMDESGQRMATKLLRATQSSERLANLVESLLDASRIATGQFALQLKEFDLVECAAAVVDGMRLPADRSRCELSFEAREPIVGLWDRLRLEQALTNLLTNAIKYGAGKPVRVAIRRDGGDAIVEVRDHGPGIPPSEMSRIFERFERAASIRHYGGLGLGLYLIQAITDAHGGTVTAANMPDGGARFQVTLPLRPTVRMADSKEEVMDIN
jgi:PAS domain S-box-containing protein